MIESIFYMMWRGIAIGILISAPMGPVGILCIQRTLDKGRRAGFFTGVGAALSDLFYCLLTGFGLSFIETFLERNHDIIQLVGSAVLIAFGVYLWRKNPAGTLRTPEDLARPSPRKDILRGFLFTFSNPLILFLIIGLFARFNFLMPEIRFYHYIVGFLFILAGAVMWWWAVTWGVDKVRAHFNLRSMWLVNRIIGSVILLFAVVGIVSSILSLTSADANAGIRHWNSRRGFSTLLPEQTRDTLPLTLHADGLSTARVCIPFDIPTREFTLTFRAANRHAHPLRRHGYTGQDGKKHKVVSPGWSVMVAGVRGDTLRISLRSEESDEAGDGISSTRCVRVSDASGAFSAVTTHLDAGTRWNSLRLVRHGDVTALHGGNRDYNPLLEIPAQLSPTSRVWLEADPGARLELDHITLHTPDATPMNRLAGPDCQETLPTLRREAAESEDEMEGEWVEYDRSLEETRLRMGGDYHLLMLATGGGDYDLVYLEGARTCSTDWTPGQLKGRLKATAIPKVWDICWIDAEGTPLERDVRGQYDPASGLLTITFPYSSGTLRLYPLR